MGKLLDYIAKETRGECFASFKYCYDNMLPPNIEYEAKEESYINMKEFAESIHDTHMRNMSLLAEKMRSSLHYSNSFLMVRAGSIRLMTYSMIKRFFQLSVDRFPFLAVAER